MDRFFFLEQRRGEQIDGIRRRLGLGEFDDPAKDKRESGGKSDQRSITETYIIDRKGEAEFDYWLDIEMTELNAVKGNFKMRRKLNRLPAIEVLMMAYMNLIAR